MSGFITKLLKISENHLYMTPILSDSIVSHFNYGPLGELLRHNVYNEWMFSNVTCRDMNVFSFCSLNVDSGLIDGIKQHYFEVKSIVHNHLPFCIVYPRIPFVQDTSKITGVKGSKYLRPRHVSLMKCLTFTTPDDGVRFFHFWLRQRKIWWRKFSADPTKFSLTDINNETENTESANIQVDFPWGTESVETVKYFNGKMFESLPEDDQKFWSLTKKKNKTFPCIIESVTNLDTACFTFLCDAFVEDFKLDTKLPYQVMKLHRKLAPYKTAIMNNTESERNDDLIYLAEYLSLSLKKNGISTLFLPFSGIKNTNEWYQYYDLLAVPFVVVLKESTLTDGVFGLRSRETTLQEQLHVTKLTEYMEMLLKNY